MRESYGRRQSFNGNNSSNNEEGNVRRSSERQTERKDKKAIFFLVGPKEVKSEMDNGSKRGRGPGGPSPPAPNRRGQQPAPLEQRKCGVVRLDRAGGVGANPA